MASVERAMAKAAAALLPGLLPTPPRSVMIAPPCFIILPASFASEPRPGRADSVERWDAHKNDKKPRSPASSCGSSSPGRGSSSEGWDTNKKTSSSSSSTSSSSSSSSRRGSSTSSSSSSSSGSGRSYGGASSSCERWDNNKRMLPSRASTADRWDAHKKPRPRPALAGTGDKKEQEDELTAMVLTVPPRKGPMFSGSTFVASPEPSMLPMPAFFRSRRNPGMVPVLAVQTLLQAH